MNTARASAVIVAAGSSTRMGAAERKPFLLLDGKTLLERVGAAFDAAENVAELVVVVREDDLERVRELVAGAPELSKVRAILPGGAERADSVRIGVQAAGEVDVILIHDAARALVTTEAIERVVRVAAEEGAAVLATPVADTLKSSSEGLAVERTVDRSKLWCAQTPQAIAAATFRDLIRRAESDGYRPTDDAALYERYVGPVPIVAGDSRNLKITTPEDLWLARAIVRERERDEEQAR